MRVGFYRVVQAVALLVYRFAPLRPGRLADLGTLPRSRLSDWGARGA